MIADFYIFKLVSSKVSIMPKSNLVSTEESSEAGWIGRDAILMTGINAIIYLASTIPPWFLVDRWGRRAILMSGGVVVCGSLGVEMLSC